MLVVLTPPSPQSMQPHLNGSCISWPSLSVQTQTQAGALRMMMVILCTTTCRVCVQTSQSTDYFWRYRSVTTLAWSGSVVDNTVDASPTNFLWWTKRTVDMGWSCEQYGSWQQEQRHGGYGAKDGWKVFVITSSPNPFQWVDNKDVTDAMLIVCLKVNYLLRKGGLVLAREMNFNFYY